jgi:hypothetical protein
MEEIDDLDDFMGSKDHGDNMNEMDDLFGGSP